jgi:RNA polymerase sigma factor (sigma-70 family)
VRQVDGYPVLTPEREYVLGLLACKGDIDARNRLVLCNQRAIIRMANEFVARHPSIEAGDIIAEANIGLLQAASSFDPRNGVMFLAYARKFIVHSVMRYLYEDAGTIRFPRHQAEMLNRIRKAVADGAKTPHEISDATKISPEDVNRLIGYLSPAISLDAPVGDGEGVMGDIILPPDRRYEDAVEQVVLRDILDRIPGNLREVLVRHYGVFGRPQESLQQIARRMKVSKEYVRKLKDKALQKCRRCA